MNQRVGQSDGAVNPDKYIQELVDAWKDGQQPLMTHLQCDAVVVAQAELACLRKKLQVVATRDERDSLVAGWFSGTTEKGKGAE